MPEKFIVRELEKPEPLRQVMVRLPNAVREKAKRLAKQESVSGHKVTETDVYRTAIMNFLDQFSTDSRDTLHEGGDAHPQAS
jgi:hypothetical protein